VIIKVGATSAAAGTLADATAFVMAVFYANYLVIANKTSNYWLNLSIPDRAALLCIQSPELGVG